MINMQITHISLGQNTKLDLVTKESMEQEEKFVTETIKSHFGWQVE